MTDIERTVHVVDDDPAMRDSLRIRLASAGLEKLQAHGLPDLVRRMIAADARETDRV
jgi:FixJ family two-component response regulator